MSINELHRMCPLCGQDNNCQHDHIKCWCVTAKFPKQVLDMIPDDKKGKACICKTCLDKYQSKEID